MKSIGFYSMVAIATIAIAGSAHASQKNEITVTGALEMAACQHQMATMESHMSCNGHSCSHENPQFTLRDGSSGKVYKLVPQQKQKNRVRLINMLFGHATMMIEMPLMLVEEITGIARPDFSGLTFSTAYQSAGGLCCKNVTVKGNLVSDYNGDVIEVKKIRVEEDANQGHSHHSM